MKSILLSQGESQGLTTYFQKPKQDLFIAQINYTINNEPINLFQYWWDALYDQFFIQFNEYLSGYNFSYNGEQINDKIGYLKIIAPESGRNNMIITSKIRYYFYPEKASNIPNLNYSKNSSNCYLNLSDCSIFSPEGGNIPVFYFDLHIKTLQKINNYSQQIVILSSIEMLR